MFGSILHPANFTISVCKMDGYIPKQNLAQSLETKTGNQRSWATRRPFSGFATVAGWRGDGARHHRRSYWWFLWWWGSMDTDEQVWHQIFFPPNHKGDTAAFFAIAKTSQVMRPFVSHHSATCWCIVGYCWVGKLRHTQHVWGACHFIWAVEGLNDRRIKPFSIKAWIDSCIAKTCSYLL